MDFNFKVEYVKAIIVAGKSCGAGLATLGLAGSGVGVVFGALLGALSLSRNLLKEARFFKYAILLDSRNHFLKYFPFYDFVEKNHKIILGLLVIFTYVGFRSIQYFKTHLHIQSAQVDPSPKTAKEIFKKKMDLRNDN